MENKYRLIFFNYIYYLLGLNKVEEYFLSNGIEYIDNKELMCFEEQECYVISHYFYLLNNINLDTLTDEEKIFLEKIDIRLLDRKVIEFLKNTFSKVLISKSGNSKVYYGPFMESEYEADKDAVAIGLKYDVYGLASGNKKSVEEYEKEKTIVENVINQIQQNAEFKIKIIIYDELHEALQKRNPLR